MIPLVQSKLSDLAEICRRRHVRRLALFGSAADDGFDPTSSDLDLLVGFEPLTQLNMPSVTRASGPPIDMKIGSGRRCIMNPAWNGEGRLRSG